MERTFSDNQLAKIIENEILNFRHIEKLRKTIFAMHAKIQWSKIFQYFTPGESITFQDLKEFYKRFDSNFS